MSAVDWVGWIASTILLATLIRQIVVQWQERSTEALSAWMSEETRASVVDLEATVSVRPISVCRE